MARHQNADAIDRIRAWMNIKTSPGIDTVAPEIVPVIVAGDLTRELVAAQLRFGIGAANPGAGGAATYACAQLWNPAGSGIDIVLERFYCHHATAHSFNLTFDTTALSTLVATRRYKDEDRYYGSNPAAYPSTGQIRTETPAAVPGVVLGIYRTGGPGTMVGNLGLRLKPGAGAILGQQTANQSIAVVFEWREERVQ